MHKDLLEVIKSDMKGLYGLIYTNCDLSSGLILRSREQPHSDYRHLVRYLLHRERPVTYNNIAEAEAALAEGLTPADHSTILHSCRVAQERLTKEHAQLYRKMSFWYDLVKSRGRKVDEYDYLTRIRRFLSEPDHVKSILLASLVEYNLVNSGMMNVLLNEYRLVDEDFLKTLVSTEGTEAGHVA